MTAKFMECNGYSQGRKPQETNTEKPRILGTELRGKTHYLHDKEVEATSQKQSTAEERQRTYYLCQGLSSQAGHKLATVKGVGKGFFKAKVALPV